MTAPRGGRRRLLAGAGLVAMAGALALVIAALVKRPGLVALALVGVALVVAAALVGATGGRRRRVVAVIVGVAGAVVLVLTLVDPFSANEGVAMPIAGALALGLFATWSIRQIRRPVLPDPTSAAHPGDEHPVLFVNPNSGRGNLDVETLTARAQALGVEVIELEEEDVLESMVRAAIASGATCLGMAGGDGSVSCVAGVAAEADLPFVCIPAGTRNHFALDVGLDRHDPLRALGGFGHDSEERRLDVARVNGRAFVNNVVLGVYARVVSDPGYREAKVGTFLTVLADLAERDEHLTPLRFDGPDGEVVEEASLVIVSNNPYRRHGLAGGMRRDHLDGGELGVVVLSDHGPAAVASTAVATALTTGEAADPVTAWTTKGLDIEAPVRVLDVAIDGEAMQVETPLHFTIRPQALRLRLPPGTHVGVAEQGDPGVKGALEALVAAVLGNDD